jgi:hypothetical protein
MRLEVGYDDQCVQGLLTVGPGGVLVTTNNMCISILQGLALPLECTTLGSQSLHYCMAWRVLMTQASCPRPPFLHFWDTCSSQ